MCQQSMQKHLLESHEVRVKCDSSFTAKQPTWEERKGKEPPIIYFHLTSHLTQVGLVNSGELADHGDTETLVPPDAGQKDLPWSMSPKELKFSEESPYSGPSHLLFY